MFRKELYTREKIFHLINAFYIILFKVNARHAKTFFLII